MAIRLTVLYPKTDDGTFDHDYYANTHVPLCLSTWGLESAEVDKGIDGPYVAAVHFRFESVEEMSEKMSNPDSAKVRADVPNYTNLTPIRQLSEIVG